MGKQCSGIQQSDLCETTHFFRANYSYHSSRIICLVLLAFFLMPTEVLFLIQNMIWVSVTSSVCFLTFLRAGSSHQHSAFRNCHITMIDSQHYNSTQLPLGPARVVGSAEAACRTSPNAPGLLGSGKNGAEASSNSSMCCVGSKQSRKSLGTGNSTNESKELSSAHWNSPRLQQWEAWVQFWEPFCSIQAWFTICHAVSERHRSLFESISLVIFL